MSRKDEEHALREHLALISTEVYLLLRATDEDERIDRYNTVQQQIDDIIQCIEDCSPTHHACLDVMYQ